LKFLGETDAEKTANDSVTPAVMVDGKRAKQETLTQRLHKEQKRQDLTPAA